MICTMLHMGCPGDPQRSRKSPMGDSCAELVTSALLLDFLLNLDQRERNVRFQCGASGSFTTRYYLGKRGASFGDCLVIIRSRDQNSRACFSCGVMAPTGTSDLDRLLCGSIGQKMTV